MLIFLICVWSIFVLPNEAMSFAMPASSFGGQGFGLPPSSRSQEDMYEQREDLNMEIMRLEMFLKKLVAKSNKSLFLEPEQKLEKDADFLAEFIVKYQSLLRTNRGLQNNSPTPGFGGGMGGMSGMPMQSQGFHQHSKRGIKLDVANDANIPWLISLAEEQMQRLNYLKNKANIIELVDPENRELCKHFLSEFAIPENIESLYQGGSLSKKRKMKEKDDERRAMLAFIGNFWSINRDVLIKIKKGSASGSQGVNTLLVAYRNILWQDVTALTIELEAAAAVGLKKGSLFGMIKSKFKDTTAGIVQSKAKYLQTSIEGLKSRRFKGMPASEEMMLSIKRALKILEDPRIILIVKMPDFLDREEIIADDVVFFLKSFQNLLTFASKDQRKTLYKKLLLLNQDPESYNLSEKSRKRVHGFLLMFESKK